MAYHKCETLTFKNKYGTLVIEPVGEVVYVRDIHGKDTPKELWFDMDTAEKIALITENWHVQLCIHSLKEVYLIAHTACEKAFRVKIVTLEYIGPANPMAEIERCNRCTPCYI